MQQHSISSKHGRNCRTHGLCPRPIQKKKLLCYHVPINMNNLLIFWLFIKLFCWNMFFNKGRSRVDWKRWRHNTANKWGPAPGSCIGPALAAACPTLSLTRSRCSCKKRTPATTHKNQITQPHTLTEKSSSVKVTGICTKGKNKFEKWFAG